jgi:hypothetical protein
MWRRHGERKSGLSYGDLSYLVLVGFECYIEDVVWSLKPMKEGGSTWIDMDRHWNAETRTAEGADTIHDNTNPNILGENSPHIFVRCIWVSQPTLFMVPKLSLKPVRPVYDPTLRASEGSRIDSGLVHMKNPFRSRYRRRGPMLAKQGI